VTERPRRSPCCNCGHVSQRSILVQQGSKSHQVRSHDRENLEADSVEISARLSTHLFGRQSSHHLVVSTLFLPEFEQMSKLCAFQQIVSSAAAESVVRRISCCNPYSP
jgi:hypothetical protein